MVLECRKQAPRLTNRISPHKLVPLGLHRANGQRTTRERPIRVNIEPIASRCPNTTDCKGESGQPHLEPPPSAIVKDTTMSHVPSSSPTYD